MAPSPIGAPQAAATPPPAVTDAMLTRRGELLVVGDDALVNARSYTEPDRFVPGTTAPGLHNLAVDSAAFQSLSASAQGVNCGVLAPDDPLQPSCQAARAGVMTSLRAMNPQGGIEALENFDQQLRAAGTKAPATTTVADTIKALQDASVQIQSTPIRPTLISEPGISPREALTSQNVLVHQQAGHLAKVIDDTRAKLGSLAGGPLDGYLADRAQELRNVQSSQVDSSAFTMPYVNQIANSVYQVIQRTLPPNARTPALMLDKPKQ